VIGRSCWEGLGVTKAFEGFMLTSAVCYNHIFGSLVEGSKTCGMLLTLGRLLGLGKWVGLRARYPLFF
jgi:hypothetical protein